MNMARVKIVIYVLAAIFIIAQFVQPLRTNPPVVPSRSLEAHVPVPADVMPILKRSCGDCHSSETVWPWYSHFAPVSWLVVDDVNTGRKHINFQDWEAQENPKEAAEHLGLICKEARTKDMPPLSYRLIHKDSRLSNEDTERLCSWSQSVGTAPETEVEEHHH
jgi:heme-binding protein